MQIVQKTNTIWLFTIHNADYTLGNCLVCFLLKSENVKVAAFGKSHPDNQYIDLVIETNNNASPKEELRIATTKLIEHLHEMESKICF